MTPDFQDSGDNTAPALLAIVLVAVLAVVNVVVYCLLTFPDLV